MSQTQLPDAVPISTTGAWLRAAGTALYLVTLPVVWLITNVLGLLLLALAPLIHLTRHVTNFLLVPFSLLGKFEDLYIYFGIAAFIGLLTGVVLYLCSSILISIFDLNSPSSDSIVPIHRTRKKSVSESSPAGGIPLQPWKYDNALVKEYTEYLEKDQAKKQGLFSETILEEDDSDGMI